MLPLIQRSILKTLLRKSGREIKECLIIRSGEEWWTLIDRCSRTNLQDLVCASITSSTWMGAGVSVLKSRQLQEALTTQRNERGAIVNNCVVVDPGRWDMWFFVHEDSSADNPDTFRYTKQKQDKMQKKKFRRLREDIQTEQVRRAERALVSSPTLDIGEYNRLAPMTRFHEPIRGVGFREFSTSKVSPECRQQTLTTFKRVPNPQPPVPSRRYATTVTRHGLLSIQMRKSLPPDFGIVICQPA
ncbi:hypothetical protein [Parasitella parasitica]|uniref:Uncharacterized protein n=1 Tax=Parasitella parasitica TaxID=35722 RepID=A0A0B7NIG0_9FUNG|nr:hypothetical protein [Parasitella parasitica]